MMLKYLLTPNKVNELIWLIYRFRCKMSSKIPCYFTACQLKKKLFLSNFWPKIALFQLWPSTNSNNTNFCNLFFHTLLVDMFSCKCKQKFLAVYVLLLISLDKYLLFIQFLTKKIAFFQLWPSANSMSANLCKICLHTLLVDMFSYKSTKGFPARLCQALDLFKFVFFTFWPTRFRVKLDHFIWI